MIVVTGATGNIGRTLLPLLADQDVVAVSRNRPDTLPAGVRHTRADLNDSTTLRPALTNADTLFLLLAGDLNTHGENPHTLIDTIIDAGVKRIVLLTSQLTETRPDSPSHARLRAFETAVRASGADHTILRPSGFASNAYAWADSIRAHRTIHAPFGDTALPVIDPADIAAVAAAALRDPSHAGRTYTLTGPEAVTPRQQAAALSQTLGEPITFVELTRDQAHAHMTQFMPPDVVEGTLNVLGAPLPAEQAPSPDVEHVLGRPATPFTDWATRNAPAFRPA